MRGQSYVYACDERVVPNTCRLYGFNSIGVHNHLPALNSPQPFLPYIRSLRFVDIPRWRANTPDENFVDVFERAFATHCDRVAKEEVTPVKDDPFLLGYAMTDCPLFTEQDCRPSSKLGTSKQPKSPIGWPCRLRNLGKSARGKQAYVATMHEMYEGKIADFNRTYDTQFDYFDALASARDWRLHADSSNTNETRDNAEFLRRIVDRFYSTARDAIRRYDATISSSATKSTVVLIRSMRCCRLRVVTPTSFSFSYMATTWFKQRNLTVGRNLSTCL